MAKIIFLTYAVARRKDICFPKRSGSGWPGRRRPPNRPERFGAASPRPAARFLGAARPPDDPWRGIGHLPGAGRSAARQAVASFFFTRLLTFPGLYVKNNLEFNLKQTIPVLRNSFLIHFPGCQIKRSGASGLRHFSKFFPRDPPPPDQALRLRPPCPIRVRPASPGGPPDRPVPPLDKPIWPPPTPRPPDPGPDQP
jgi:hypothetical protein